MNPQVQTLDIDYGSCHVIVQPVSHMHFHVSSKTLAALNPHGDHHVHLMLMNNMYPTFH